jgi:hypothetical protein
VRVEPHRQDERVDDEERAGGDPEPASDRPAVGQGIEAGELPIRTGNGIAASQRKISTLAAASRTVASASSPPADTTVPPKRRMPARIMRTPCTASVLATEMNPPTAV